MKNLKTYILILFSILYYSVLQGANVTVVFDATIDEGYISSYANNKPDSIVKDGISMKCSIASLGNGTDYRFYKNSTLQIESKVGDIIKIVIYCETNDNAGNGPGKLQSKGYTTEGKQGIWQGDGQRIVSFTASNECKAIKVEVTYDNDLRQKPQLRFPNDTYTMLYGDEFGSPKLINSHNVDVSFCSSCEDVAEINSSTGELNLVGIGETTISAIFKGNDTYRPDSVSYLLNVTNTMKEVIDLTNPSLYGYSSTSTLEQGSKFLSNKVSVEISAIGKWKPHFEEISKDTVFKVSSTSIMDFHIDDGYLISGIYMDAKPLLSSDTIKKSSWNGYGQEVKIDSFFMDCPVAITSFTIEYKLQNLTFDETKLNPYEDMEKANVKLLRKLSPEYWNTFCSPFDIPEEQIQSVWGDETQIRRYVGDEGNVMKFEEVDSIKAGTAYLIKPTKTVETPIFTDVNVKSNAVYEDDEIGTLYKFKGCIDKTDLDESKDFFITTHGTVSAITPGKNAIRGMRAYIEVMSPTSNAKNITLSIDDTTTRVFPIIKNESSGQTKMFSLGGLHVGTKSLAKGMYIINGNKIVR